MKRVLIKSLAIIMVCVCLLSCLSGCSVVSKWSGFYKSKILAFRGLEGLKKPNYKFVHNENIYCDIFGNIEYAEFENYAEYVYNFLNERFSHIGTGGVYEFGSFFGGAGDYDFIYGKTTFEDFRIETEGSIIYEFVYFQENPEIQLEENKKHPNKYGGVDIPSTGNHVTLRYQKEPATRNIGSDEKPKKISYNFYMSILKIGLYDRYFWCGENLVTETTQTTYLHGLSIDLKSYDFCDVIYKVSSLAYYEEYYSNNINAETNPLTEKFKEYDETFFEEKQLAMVCVKLKKGQNARVNSYSIEYDEAVCIKMEYYEDATITEPQNMLVFIPLPINTLYERAILVNKW